MKRATWYDDYTSVMVHQQAGLCQEGKQKREAKFRGPSQLRYNVSVVNRLFVPTAQ